MDQQQIIPARHGVATFVPAGRVIKIINTSGTQVVDTWAFALPKPEEKLEKVAEAKQEDNTAETEQAAPKKGKAETEEPATPAATPAATPKKSKKSNKTELPSQEDAEKATSQAAVPEKSKTTPAQKSTWSSYVPSLPSWSSKKDAPKDGKNESQRQKDSRTWASYFPTGKGFSAYIPKSASDTLSGFASSVSLMTTC